MHVRQKARLFVNGEQGAQATVLTLLGAVRWRRGSVVRTSIFNWRTFPDLRLIYGWHVTTSWVKCPLSTMGQPTRPTQPFIRRGR